MTARYPRVRPIGLGGTAVGSELGMIILGWGACCLPVVAAVVGYYVLRRRGDADATGDRA